MMPLWMTTMRPDRVAVRVGVLLGRAAVRRPARVPDRRSGPGGGADAIFSVRFPSLPSLLATRTSPSSPTTAMPAES